jgi:hypothetical protein
MSVQQFGKYVSLLLHFVCVYGVLLLYKIICGRIFYYVLGYLV